MIKLWNLGRICSRIKPRRYFDFHGLQIDTLNTKSARRDIIIERIRPKFHSLNIIEEETELGQRNAVMQLQGCQVSSQETTWQPRDDSRRG